MGLLEGAGRWPDYCGIIQVIQLTETNLTFRPTNPILHWPLSQIGQPTILGLGSEGTGLRTLVARQCDSFVRIPGGTFGGDPQDTPGHIDSLNVAVAAGILINRFAGGYGGGQEED